MGHYGFEGLETGCGLPVRACRSSRNEGDPRGVYMWMCDVMIAILQSLTTPVPDAQKAFRKISCGFGLTVWLQRLELWVMRILNPTALNPSPKS